MRPGSDALRNAAQSASKDRATNRMRKRRQSAAIWARSCPLLRHLQFGGERNADRATTWSRESFQTYRPAPIRGSVRPGERDPGGRWMIGV
jgi:hypothetical protein